jgi:hypothetical protein
MLIVEQSIAPICIGRSRKQFFTHVWDKLRSIQSLDEQCYLAKKTDESKYEFDDRVDCTNQNKYEYDDKGHCQNPIISWREIMGDNDIVTLKDRPGTSDALLAMVAQLRICEVRVFDVNIVSQMNLILLLTF